MFDKNSLFDEKRIRNEKDTVKEKNRASLGVLYKLITV
jgi:hypothetical protein